MRISMYRDYLSQVSLRLNKSRIISIHLDKSKPKYASSPSRDIQDWAWEVLIQRFQTFLVRNGGGDTGLVFADQTNEPKLRRLLRRMRQASFVPSMFGGKSLSLPVINIIDDPVMRNSTQSYFIQTADLAVHALYRKRHPKGSLKRHNVDRLYDLLNPILLKEASRKDPQGIVDL